MQSFREWSGSDLKCCLIPSHGVFIVPYASSLMSFSVDGFNIYRSHQQKTGYQRINEGLIPHDDRNEYIDDSVVPGETYWYRLGSFDDDGEWMSQTVSLTVPVGSLSLYQNLPNPFNPATTISFTLPNRVQTRLSIYNIAGKQVARLVDQVVEAGFTEITWNGRDDRGNPVSSGGYFYRLTAGKRTLEKKMLLLK